MKVGYVYLIEAEGLDRIKIGWTADDPDGRLKACQVGCPVKLTMIRYFPGTRATERQIHRRFESRRVCGEWFSANDELRSLVGEPIEGAPLIAKKPRAVAIGFEKEHLDILDRWAKKLSPGLEPDRSAMIRRILHLTEHCLDEPESD